MVGGAWGVANGYWLATLQIRAGLEPFTNCQT
jgi:hypothetical protein